MEKRDDESWDEERTAQFLNEMQLRVDYKGLVFSDGDREVGFSETVTCAWERVQEAWPGRIESEYVFRFCPSLDLDVDIAVFRQRFNSVNAMEWRP